MKKYLTVFIFVFIFSVSAFAHPGRTDQNGGHYDRSTGEYHYHTGEYAGQKQYNTSSHTENNSEETEETGTTDYWELAGLPKESLIDKIARENGTLEEEQKEINTADLGSGDTYNKETSAYNANETNLKRANDMLVIFLSLVIVVAIAVLIKNIAMLKNKSKKSAPIKKQVKEPVKNNVAHKTEEHFPTMEELEALSVEELFAGIEERRQVLADIKDEWKAAKEELRIAEIERNNLIKAKALKNLIPPDIAIDSRGLPYKTNRVYGYGKLFNVFVAKNGEYFHRSKCGYIKHHQKFLLHRYEAIKLNYSPCPFCHPISTIDKWYLDYENYMHNDKNN